MKILGMIFIIYGLGTTINLDYNEIWITYILLGIGCLFLLFDMIYESVFKLKKVKKKNE